MAQLAGSSVVFKERLLFFRRWLDNPLQLGALAPSSRALGNMIAQRVVWENQAALLKGHYILELGAGTGVFTEALLRAGVPASQLVCVELDESLHRHLAEKFPAVQVLNGDACLLDQVLPLAIKDRIAAVVSGIPMITVPRVAQSRIIYGIFHVMMQGGRLYQFTYSPFSSIGAKNFNLKKRRLGTVFRNFPPATVWSYERPAQCSLR